MVNNEMLRTWTMFIALISDNKKEQKLLTKLYYKQLHRIENFNKGQLANIQQIIKNKQQNQNENNQQQQQEIEDHLETDDSQILNELEDVSDQNLLQNFKSKFKSWITKAKDEVSEIRHSKSQITQQDQKEIEDEINSEDTQDKHKLNEKYSKIKFTTYLKEDGHFYKNHKKLPGNFYNDLNYGDLVMKFPNSEFKIVKGLKLKKNIKKLDDVYQIFLKNINLNCDLKQIDRDYLVDEKIAFFNALWFYSEDFYFKQKQSTLSNQDEEGNTITQDGFILENYKDANELYDPFNVIIEGWEMNSPEDYKEIQKDKTLYKSMIFIKFLNVSLQQENKNSKHQQLLIYKAKILVSIYQNQIQELQLQQDFINQEISQQMQQKQKEKQIQQYTQNIQELNKAIYQNNMATIKEIINIHRKNYQQIKLDDIVKSFKILQLFNPFNENFYNFRKQKEIHNYHFQSLIRKIIILKMNKLNLAIRQFNSSNFKFIFVVIKIQKSTLRERAELQGFPKSLELGLIDLISFDPLDSRNRPFRIKNIIIKEFEETKKKTEEEKFETLEASAKRDFKYLSANGGNQKKLVQLIQTIEQLSIYDMKNLCTYQQLQFNGLIDQLLKRTKVNIVSNTIVNDKFENRINWTAYVIYTMLFRYYTQGLKKLRKMDCFREYEGLTYRLIALKALQDTNKAFIKYNTVKFNQYNEFSVKTLWNELGLAQSFSPFVSYSSNKKLKGFWRTFQINELGDRSIFLQTERITILYQLISTSFQIDDMVKDNLILDYFPLNDEFMMEGKFKLPLFIHLLDIEKLTSPNYKRQEKEIQKFLSILYDNADDSDFIDTSLKQDLRIRFLTPWFLPIDPIRDYFGEQIAIYFEFLTYYSKAKIIMAFVGLIVFILQQVFLNKIMTTAYRWSTLVYGGIILFWAILVTEYWKRRQALFALRFGQDIKDPFKKQIVRPGFKGIYQRYRSSNEMNYLYYSPRKRFWRYVITYSLSILFVLISLAISLFLLRWKNSVDPTDVNMNFLITLVNAIAIFILQAIYNFLSVIFNNYENHSTTKNYTNSLIMKQFMFNFMNTFNSMFLIAFVKPYISYFGQCVQREGQKIEGIDCFNELSIQVTTVFIIAFVLNFLPITILYIKQKVIPFLTNTIQKLIKKKKIRIKSYDWKLIDRQIEKQSKKEVYQATLQVDGTLSDFMTVMNQYTFLCLFSISFPLAFLIAMIGGFFQVHLDKYKLFFFFKRPMPQSAANIGLWELVLEFILILTVFVNAAIFSFTLQGFSENSTIANQLTVFLIIILIFFVFKLIFQSVLSDVPGNFKIMIQRHQRVKNLVTKAEFVSQSINLRAGVFLQLNSSIREDFRNKEKKMNQQLNLILEQLKLNIIKFQIIMY